MHAFQIPLQTDLIGRRERSNDLIRLKGCPARLLASPGKQVSRKKRDERLLLPLLISPAAAIGRKEERMLPGKEMTGYRFFRPRAASNDPPSAFPRPIRLTFKQVLGVNKRFAL
jgi:hypothetical protein